MPIPLGFHRLGHFGITVAGQIDQPGIGAQCKKIDQSRAPRGFTGARQLALGVSVLMALDLPALERPAKATSTPVSAGHSASEGALLKNAAW